MSVSVVRGRSSFPEGLLPTVDRTHGRTSPQQTGSTHETSPGGSETRDHLPPRTVCVCVCMCVCACVCVCVCSEIYMTVSVDTDLLPSQLTHTLCR